MLEFELVWTILLALELALPFALMVTLKKDFFVGCSTAMSDIVDSRESFDVDSLPK